MQEVAGVTSEPAEEVVVMLSWEAGQDVPDPLLKLEVDTNIWVFGQQFSIMVGG